MSLLLGTGIGVAGAAVGAGAAALTRRFLEKNDNCPPELYEHSVDNFWFEGTDYYTRRPNAPLKGEQKADIVIVGGGYAGMACAYQLIQRYPQKRIVLIDGAVCGFGASGRNGGHAMAGLHGLQAIAKKKGAEVARNLWDVSYHGIELIQEMMEKHGVDCDFAQNGMVVMAEKESQIPALKKFQGLYDTLGLESTWYEQDEIRKKFKTTRYIAGWKQGYGAFVHPAKLAFGMRDMIEKMGVEIFEQSRVKKIDDGKTLNVVTEYGTIKAPQVVIALNGYAPKSGFFTQRIIPASTNVVATEPLTADQMESIGWEGREGWCDMRGLDFPYVNITKDNRIVIGGEGLDVFYNNGIHTGPHTELIEKIKKSLFLTFPQLEGVKFTHEWGGTIGMTNNMWPSMGAIGSNKNLFYIGGWNGEGVAMSHVGGKIIADLVSGEETEYTKLPFANHMYGYSGIDPMRIVGTKAYLKYLEKFGTNMLI